MMISLVQHIEYLMIYNDCVVIPGWGALIANYRPSTVKGSIMECPQRTIAFNGDINHNDGMLANSLMRRHHMSYEQACSFIADNFTTFRRQLNDNAELAFGHMGYFILNDQKILEFVPMSKCEASDEFFGLSNFEIPAIASDSNVVSTATIVHADFGWREKIKVAASIVAIVGVGLLLSTPVIIDKTTQNASLNVAEVKTNTQQTPSMPTNQVTVKPSHKTTAEDNSFVLIENTKKSNDDLKNSSQEKTIKEKTKSSDDVYLLAIESCSSSSKAKSMSKRYEKKGIETQIVNRDDKFLIVIAQSDNKRELKKIKKSSHEFKKAWICN